MIIKYFILDLYKKGNTAPYIANLLYKKMIKMDSNYTRFAALNLVEKTILEFTTTQRT